MRKRREEVRGGGRGWLGDEIEDDILSRVETEVIIEHNRGDVE